MSAWIISRIGVSYEAMMGGARGRPGPCVAVCGAHFKAVQHPPNCPAQQLVNMHIRGLAQSYKYHEWKTGAVIRAVDGMPSGEQ